MWQGHTQQHNRSTHCWMRMQLKKWILFSLSSVLGQGVLGRNIRRLMLVKHLKQWEDVFQTLFQVKRGVSWFEELFVLFPGLFAQRAVWFLRALIFCMRHTQSGLRMREGTAGGLALSPRAWDDVTCRQCGNTHAILHFYAQTIEQSHSRRPNMQAQSSVCKQTTEEIYSLVSCGVTGSHEHEYMTARTQTHTHTRLYHSFPYGQLHLKGNGLESDTELYLTPHFFPIVILPYVCVCLLESYNTTLLQPLWYGSACVDNMIDQANMADVLCYTYTGKQTMKSGADFPVHQAAQSSEELCNDCCFNRKRI